MRTAGNVLGMIALGLSLWANELHRKSNGPSPTYYFIGIVAIILLLTAGALLFVSWLRWKKSK